MNHSYPITSIGNSQDKIAYYISVLMMKDLRSCYHRILPLQMAIVTWIDFHRRKSVNIDSKNSILPKRSLPDSINCYLMLIEYQGRNKQHLRTLVLGCALAIESLFHHRTT